MLITDHLVGLKTFLFTFHAFNLNFCLDQIGPPKSLEGDDRCWDLVNLQRLTL
jgi:hypothetical protein